MRIKSYFKHFCQRIRPHSAFSAAFHKLSTLNSQLSTLIFISAFSISHALDPMYDYRYTLGPEILVPDAFHFGLGAFTRRNEDLTTVFNIQIGLMNEFEIGMKAMGGTNDKWIMNKYMGPHDPWDLAFLMDIGAKYAISKNLSLQADIPIALNKDRDWGGIISLTQWDGYTKNVSFLYEGRLGFGGAAGEDRYVKPALALFPYFQIGESLRLSAGVIGSGSNYFKDDFMLDILPRVEAGFAWFRLMGEVSIGILTWRAEKYNRYALFIVADV